MLFSISILAQTSIYKIDKNWTYKEADAAKWHPAEVPGSVHTDLYNNGFIPHPFIGNNELDLQWISEKEWLYQTEFQLNKKQLKSKNIQLNFDGLDTYAKVYLNDKLILETNNAFRSWNKNVRKILKTSNKLRIEFTPTEVIESKKRDQIPYKLPEDHRIFTRKAQFQYGWDWGPTFNTFGVWRDVYLEFWDNNKIEDLYIKQLSLDKEEAKLIAEIELKNPSKNIHKAMVYVNGQFFTSKVLDKNSNFNKLEIPISINNPMFWWTANLGDPYLYDIKVQLTDKKGDILTEKSVKKGLRTIELVTEKDKLGESFYFKLNGEPVYMKGANYIPQNSFQNWVKEEDYDKLLDNVVESNMNMLRVWGGGIYEDDYFYELCDQKGILIWQDFMFSTAMYPGDNSFLENVKQEAIYNVKRLRNHASIALWCGNNEVSEGWHRWGWQHDRSEKEKNEIWGNYLKLFDVLLPEVVNNLTETPYWETSPKFGRGDQRYIKEGDAHDWWIWHDGKPFEELERKVPRFMSEFGFQAYPSSKTIKYINDNQSTSITSNNFKTHQKHHKGFEIIRTYMERDFPVPTKEEDYVYVSQLLQAYGIGMGIEAQRRNKPNTMGSLYWQLNDCWPAASWSGIDYFGQWKALQYQVRHSFDNLLISFERHNNELKVYIVNDQLKDIKGKFSIETSSFTGITLEKFDKEIVSSANSSQVVFQFDVSQLQNYGREIYIKANFNGKESLYYLVKPKDLILQKGQLQVDLNPLKDGYELVLLSNVFQKNLMLDTDVEGEFSDNFFDLLPNQVRKVYFRTNASNFDRSQLKFMALNNIIQTPKVQQKKSAPESQ